jgi:hypothetical protein
MAEQDHGNNEDDDRPWDQPGQERRDCLPHRGESLFNWANVGFFCNFFSLCCFPATIFGMPLCLFIIIQARLDLAEIASGTRERAGEDSTRMARDAAFIGFIFGLIACLAWGLFVAFVEFA